jgi:hypothetical protein
MKRIERFALITIPAVVLFNCHFRIRGLPQKAVAYAGSGAAGRGKLGTISTLDALVVGDQLSAAESK